MKKSKAVPATLVASLTVVVLTGCSQSRHCVDKMGNVLPDSACRRTGGGMIYPHWVYGGTRSGNRITGGSTTAPNSSVSRSGFGGGRSSASYGG